MRGLVNVTDSEPKINLPDNWEGLSICLQMTGGIGDVLIAVGSSANTLKSKQCKITAAVRDFQIPLTRQLYGIDEVIEGQKLNNPSVRNKFDVVINFAGVFNNQRYLKKNNYYKLVSERLGQEVEVGKFKFQYTKQYPRVCLHPGASNPNRRWSEEKWEELATKLSSKLEVMWLGTKDEFGFNSHNILKLSDCSDKLEFQAKYLARSACFIGNDSGFAHIAGIYGVWGLVIFSATHPDDVIANYASLSGVHAFENYDSPSRSLRVDDSISREYLEKITVDDILVAGDFGNIEVKEAVKISSDKQKIALVGTSVEANTLTNYLMRYFDITQLSNMPTRDFEAVLILTQDVCQVQVNDRKVRVATSNYENVRRALRELLV